MVDTQVSATPYYIGRFPDSQDLDTMVHIVHLPIY